ncbi:MAG: DUF1015 domain-containing protein [Anaerolineaceae bacterium]|nr:DUF1015 domain-containing protein [Anaerolineaceae bacterium]
MRMYPNIAIGKPDILLPRKDINMNQWAVIACDQFTSEPEYWQDVKEIVADAPSTLNLILPEVYLGKAYEKEITQTTQKNMSNYLDQGILVEHEGFILVKRSVDGKTRHGILLALDLESYDFNVGSQSLTRATEGTILDRLPPRIKIRENALLELPHILVLIDDPDRTVIEPIVAQQDKLRKLYDFDLMKDSGHLTGYAIEDEKIENQMISALEMLADPNHFHKKYDVQTDLGVLLFAMGDGNHSLATAKAIWERIKSDVGMDHPARYALIELENVHDTGLKFEPIHRVLFSCKEDYKQALKSYYGDSFVYHPCKSYQQVIDGVYTQAFKGHTIGLVSKDEFALIQFTKTNSNLPVGTLQPFLDQWVKSGGVQEIDYVHGDDVVLRLGQQESNLGLLLPPMPKSDLFKTVILDGALPRKTFSMGEAHEKRFYVECRKIEI